MVRRLFLVSIVIAYLGVAMGGEKPEGIPEAAKAWTVQFEGTVQWQRVAPVGMLVVSTSKGLHGVDPEKGKIVWRQAALQNLDPSSYRPIANSPYVLLSQDGVADRIVILDTLTGHVLFESSSAGVAQVLSTHLLPRNRGLLVFGIREAKTAMFLLDATSGSMRWMNEDIFKGENKLTRFAATLVQSLADHSGVVYDPVEIGEEAFLLSTGTGVYRVDARTGDFDWNTGSVNGASRTRLYLSAAHPELFFAGSEVESSGSSTAGLVYTYYSAHRVADGQATWSKPVKLKGSANDVIFLDGGMLVASAPDGGGKIKLIDYGSGQSLWGKKGKGLDVPGSVVDHVRLDDGLLLATGKDSVWTRAGTDYLLTIVDEKTGTLRFDKPLKVKGRLLHTEKISGGVLYVTTSEINIIDPGTGKQRFERAFVSDGSLVTASRAEQLYAFSQQDGALFVVDKGAGKRTALSTEKVKVQDKDVVELLEVTDERITVVCSQNVISFDHSGKMLHHTHHAAPRLPTAVRILYGALAFRSAMASAASGVYSGAFAEAATEQEQGSLGHTMATELSRGYGELSQGYAGLSEDYFRAMNSRFQASARSSDLVFMMTRFAGEGIGLAGVSKETGEIVSRVDLGSDREPNYAVDAIANRVYYNSSPNVIEGYEF